MNTASFIDLEDVRHPEDVFGEDPAKIHSNYRILSQVYHPDVPAGSEESFKKLGELYQSAKDKVSNGVYGQRFLFTFETKTHKYTITHQIDYLSDKVNSVYVGKDQDDQEVIVKIPYSNLDNDLIQKEFNNFTAIHKNGPSFYFLHPIETARLNDKIVGCYRLIEDPSSFDQDVSLNTWYTLQELASYVKDVPQSLRHCAWIYRRILIGSSHAKRNGLFLCDITPLHVLIHPSLHGLVFSSMVNSSQDSSITLFNYDEGIYPPETKDKSLVNESSVLYMSASTMLYVIRHCETDDSTAHSALLKFFTSIVSCTPKQRPDDSVALLKEFETLLYRIWGHPKFVNLILPKKGI